MLLGKLATHEFGIGGPSLDLPLSPARNPWHKEHFTGGSIRGPAAYCGVVGLKPTYGRVSRCGVFPLSYTVDHCGPLACSAEDVAICLQAVAGLDAGVAGLRVGVPQSLFATVPDLSPDVLASIDATVERLRAAGATVEETTLPDFALFNACGRVILASKAFAIHEADLRARLLDYGCYAMQRMVLGAAITAPDLVQAFRLRRES